MLGSYVDESYSDDFYFIAAAIAPRETWERVAKSFVEIRGATARLHRTALDIELHGHELMGGKGEWTILRGRHREAAGVYLAALKICRAEGVKYVFRGVDLVRLRNRYAKPVAPHGIVFGHLLERIDDYAKRLDEDDKVIVIADEIATQAVHQKEFESYTLTGTPGYRSNRLARIATPIHFTSSRTSAGLQAADLAAYFHHRRCTKEELHPAARATMARLAQEVSPATVHEWVWLP